MWCVWAVMGVVSDGGLLVSSSVPPMFLSTSPQVDVIISSTDPVILNCSLRGYPLSVLRWRKDDTTLDPDDSHITITPFRRQDPTDPYPFSSTTDSSFEPIPLEGLEYFEAVSELTLAPPLLRTDIADYTCEVVAVFVQNFTVTSDSIPVNVFGECSCGIVQYIYTLQLQYISLVYQVYSPPPSSNNYLPTVLETSFRLSHLGGELHNI